MRVPGRVSVSKAARLLGLPYRTFFRYCSYTLSGENINSKPIKWQQARVTDIVQDPKNKYITVSLEEIQILRSNKKGTML